MRMLHHTFRDSRVRGWSQPPDSKPLQGKAMSLTDTNSSGPDRLRVHSACHRAMPIMFRMLKPYPPTMPGVWNMPCLCRHGVRSPLQTTFSSEHSIPFLHKVEKTTQKDCQLAVAQSVRIWGRQAYSLLCAFYRVTNAAVHTGQGQFRTAPRQGACSSGYHHTPLVKAQFTFGQTEDR